jgi:hypothetical protein
MLAFPREAMPLYDGTFESELGVTNTSDTSLPDPATVLVLDPMVVERFGKGNLRSPVVSGYEPLLGMTTPVRPTVG